MHEETASGSTAADVEASGGSRRDGDQWDLASSVGVTATMSAAARAIATRESPAFFSDPWAEQLVRAVGIDFLTRLASGELSPSGLVEPTWVDVAKIRGRFYDNFFLDAGSAGITQMVILASGLDSRAFRLPWPSGTVVYEVDQPKVIEFKARELSRSGRPATAERSGVGVDLRDDWPAALTAAGFDRTRPTAWGVEGLLGYLPPDAQDRLLTDVTNLSAPGSRLATESRPNPGPGQDAATREHLRSMVERWREHSFVPDLVGGRYDGLRNEAAPYLGQLGWTVEGSSLTALSAAHGLHTLSDDDIGLGETLLVQGVLEQDGR